MASTSLGAEKGLQIWSGQHGNKDSYQPSSKSVVTADDLVDPEKGFDGKEHLLNTTVHSLMWTGVTVTVKDRNTKELRNIVDNVEGIVEAGEFKS